MYVMSKQVILTGIRANNDLTIGNYFGAIMPTIDMARKRSGDFQVNLFVPDLHSFTTPVDHTELQAAIWNNLRIFAAAGLPLDNPGVHVYRQSYIPAHSEMTWILDCFTGFGEMNRMTQLKDKSVNVGEDRVSVGLFNYPVLMAADILLYGATYVPVGDDQTQHLEFTRDIAERLNNKFNQDLLVVPKTVKEQHAFFDKDQGLRIKDLQEPTKKMSKSDVSSKGVVFLGDSPDEAASKIMSAATDSVASVNLDWENQPGISNLLQLLSLLTKRPLADVVSEWQGNTRYGDFKTTVAEEVKKFLTELQSNLNKVDDDNLRVQLELSEKEMNKQANETLLKVQRAVGLRA
jgi:tryptophanyl-tRNA synthetase